MIHKEIPWADPIIYARAIDDNEEEWALLYSGMDHGFSGNKSYLALRPLQTISSDSFKEFEEEYSDGCKKGEKSPQSRKFSNCWLGYLSYELRHDLENLICDESYIMEFPALHMTKFGLIIEFNHKEHRAIAYGRSTEDLLSIPSADISNNKGCSENGAAAFVSNLSSNMSKREYLAGVASIKSAIKEGDLCQANLTRKFHGDISYKSAADIFDIFIHLAKVSPAPYSSFFKLNIKNPDINTKNHINTKNFDINTKINNRDGDKKGGDNKKEDSQSSYSYIISSTPERFIAIDAWGNIDCRPIKGTAARGSTMDEDRNNRKNLQNSIKDQAENLMIVDLMRNDLSRHCKIGSVKVSDLFKITTHSTIHHMSSTICGVKNSQFSIMDIVKGCFPPGSMTGAPKIKAMDVCSRLERVKRGIYSGAIGAFFGDNSCDLSVVIRTIIVQGNKFEFQVGGAIIHDSDPQKEWLETLDKAKAVSQVLGIDRKKLEGI